MKFIKKFLALSAFVPLVSTQLVFAQSSSPSPSATPTLGCVGYRCEAENCSVELRNVVMSPNPIHSGVRATLKGELVATGKGCGQKFSVTFNERTTTVNTISGKGKFTFSNIITDTPSRNAGGALCAVVQATEDISFIDQYSPWARKEAAVDTLHLEFPVYACNDVNLCPGAICADMDPPEDKPYLACPINGPDGHHTGYYGTLVAANTCDSHWGGDCTKGYVKNACGFGYCDPAAMDHFDSLMKAVELAPVLGLMLVEAYSKSGGNRALCEDACERAVQNLSGYAVDWNRVFFIISDNVSYGSEAMCSKLCNKALNLCPGFECMSYSRIGERCAAMGTTLGKSCAEAALAAYNARGCGSRVFN